VATSMASCRDFLPFSGHASVPHSIPPPSQLKVPRLKVSSTILPVKSPFSAEFPKWQLDDLVLS